VDQTPKEKSRLEWGSGRVAFLAHQEQIRQMITAGHPQRHIYNQLEKELGGLSYSQFSWHVRKKLLDQKTVPVLAPDEPVKAEPERAHEKPKKPGTGTTRFKPGPRVPDPSQLY
jgi:Family of unknown function (DUF5338)